MPNTVLNVTVLVWHKTFAHILLMFLNLVKKELYELEKARLTFRPFLLSMFPAGMMLSIMFPK